MLLNALYVVRYDDFSLLVIADNGVSPVSKEELFERVYPLLRDWVHNNKCLLLKSYETNGFFAYLDGSGVLETEEQEHPVYVADNNSVVDAYVEEGVFVTLNCKARIINLPVDKLPNSAKCADVLFPMELEKDICGFFYTNGDASELKDIVVSVGANCEILDNKRPSILYGIKNIFHYSDAGVLAALYVAMGIVSIWCISMIRSTQSPAEHDNAVRNVLEVAVPCLVGFFLAFILGKVTLPSNAKGHVLVAVIDSAMLLTMLYAVKRIFGLFVKFHLKVVNNPKMISVISMLFLLIFLAGFMNMTLQSVALYRTAQSQRENEERFISERVSVVSVDSLPVRKEGSVIGISDDLFMSCCDWYRKGGKGGAISAFFGMENRGGYNYVFLLGGYCNYYMLSDQIPEQGYTLFATRDLYERTGGTVRINGVKNNLTLLDEHVYFYHPFLNIGEQFNSNTILVCSYDYAGIMSSFANLIGNENGQKAIINGTVFSNLSEKENVELRRTISYSTGYYTQIVLFEDYFEKLGYNAAAFSMFSMMAYGTGMVVVLSFMIFMIYKGKIRKRDSDK